MIQDTNRISENESILIVGGTGFIGQHLIKRCLKDTSHITCIGISGKPDKKVRFKNVEFITTDISRQSQLKSALRGKSFDYVFNLGGYIDHTPFFMGGRSIIEAHFVSLMNLLACLDRERLKGFVQIGSSDEYGNAPAPQKERMREMPISPYSLAKTASSHFIQMLYRAEGFPGVVLRLFLVYGPGQDDRRFLPQIIKACLKDESFKTSEGKQLRDFCYVDDVVDAMVRSVLSPAAKGNIINIASGIPVSIREMVEKVIRSIGKGRPLWGTHLYREAEHMELYADIAIAQRLLGWSAFTTLEAGLKKTIEYYKKRNGK